MVHTHTFTHRGFYTQTLLHRGFYTQTLLHRGFYTQTLLHTDTFTRRRFYTQTLFVYTHLLRTVIANFDVERILRAKNTPITPDRNGSVKRPEKNWKGTIAMSSARRNKLTDCEDRANRKIWKQVIWKRHGGSWVGHIPCPKMKQARDKGIPSSYHHGKAVSSLVDDCQTMNPPPAVWLEVLHLFRCFTHTHTFTHRHFYTEAFTHRHFYTKTLLHTDTFTHRHVYPKTLLHTDAFRLHTLAQNSHCEFWCGMHLTCKKHFNKTWQEMVDDQRRETVPRNSFKVRARSNISI